MARSKDEIREQHSGFREHLDQISQKVGDFVDRHQHEHQRCICLSLNVMQAATVLRWTGLIQQKQYEELVGTAFTLTLLEDEYDLACEVWNEWAQAARLVNGLGLSVAANLVDDEP